MPVLIALAAMTLDRERAVRLHREVAANDLGNHLAHVQLARIHEAARRWDEALVERRAAVDADNEHHSMDLDLGTLLARTGRHGEAEAALEQARTLHPRDPRVVYRLGVVLQAPDRRAEAAAAFERFIATAPGRFAPAVADARARLAQSGN